MSPFTLKPLLSALQALFGATQHEVTLGRSMVRGVQPEWDLLTCVTALALVAKIHNSRTQVKLTAMSLMYRTSDPQLREALAMFTESRDPIRLVWLTIEEMGL